MEAPKHIVEASAALVTGSGAITFTLSFFNENAAGIGAMCTLSFGLVYIVFQFMAHKKLTLADANKQELQEQSNKLDSHITEINDKFDKIYCNIEILLNRK